MTEHPSASLTLAEARELLAASVARQARVLKVPAMLIKGPTLAAHGLREARESVDVDLWASPAAVDRLIAALKVRGWHVYAEDTTAHVIAPASVTLIHQAWPLELDLHHAFPGFLAEPQVVFDRVWARRQAFTQAGQGLAMPDLLSSVLIAALHYERSADIRQPDLADLSRRVRVLVGDTQMLELAELADQTGCADTLRRFLDSLGAPAIGAGRSDPDALDAWQLLINGGGVPGVAWIETLRRARWCDRPAILLHAFLFTEDELRYRFPDAPAGARGIWLARWWRLRQAVKALPEAERVLRARRRAKP